MKKVFHVTLLISLLTLILPNDGLIAQLAGNRYQPRLPSMKLTLEGGISFAGNDFTKPSNIAVPCFAGGVNVGFLFGKYFLLGVDFGAGTMKTDRDNMVTKSTYGHSMLRAELRYQIPRSRFVIFGYARGGLLLYQPEFSSKLEDADVEYSEKGKTLGTFAYGIGVGSEVMISRNFSFQIEAGLNTTSSDKLDYFKIGDKNDGWAHFGIGLSYYLPLRRGAR
jgi:hypothetical protein